MSKIIWKGIDSDTINGLIISKLPPITKPKMRTNIIKIDGVDGDIIDDLGYESYEKKLEIGLSFNYDINQIIKFFSGEGTLILSDEPDKYYIAKIIKKIDYSSLIRFKKATVVFYCQPYKYKNNEVNIDTTIDLETAIIVNNIGTENSHPKITLFGTGEIGFYLNNHQIFLYKFDDDSQVVIDSEKQDAYLGSVLKNRNMLGEFPFFAPGENVITWFGNLTRIIVEPKSRWL